MRVTFGCTLSNDRSLSAFLRGGPSLLTLGVAGPASVTDVAFSTILAGHRASNVSGSDGADAFELGAHACESRGVRGFSGAVLLVSSPEAGRVDTSLGHSNNDLESPGLPSYQHFRPSIIR